ncbi:MAG: polysaccharide biosynthesis C-terminal domain-containing protein [Clostridia bacterium]|nr:polysaccharide biosynthesis C-terminal domain-containing protein [Clostridia bacterium]
MLKIKSARILNGPIFSSILLYSLPLMISTLLQVLFNAADLAVVGNMADGNAIASVGATSPIVNLCVTSAVGLASGISIILPRCLGAKDDERTKRIVDTALVLAVVLGAILSVVAFFASPWLLDMTACPEECYVGALTYLRIYMFSIPFALVYNFGSAIIRITGDSTRPMMYMIAAGATNMFLNIILCFTLADKVAAVAIATLASQVIGSVLVIIHLCRIDGPCKIKLSKIRPHLGDMLSIIRFGLPGAFNTALFSLSNLQIQSAINAYGPDAISGNTAAGYFEMVVASLSNSVADASIVFIGQNLGAENNDRVKKTIFSSIGICFTLGMLGPLLYLLGKPLLGIFLPHEPIAVEFGIVRMRYILAIYFVGALNSALSSVQHAFGYPILPMLNSVVNVLLFRVIWMTFIYPFMPTVGVLVEDIANLYVCYTFSWSLCLIVNIIVCSIIYIRFRKGKYKRV